MSADDLDRQRPSAFAGLKRVLRPLRRPAIETDDEIRFHIEMRTQDLVDRGVPRDEARARALNYFGDVDAVRSTLDALNTQEIHRMRMHDWLEARAYDARFALRALTRFPGVTVAVVSTLALGVGANLTMFGIVDRLLLSPPPYLAHADRVSRVYITTPRANGGDFTSASIGYRRYRELAVMTSSFDALGVSHSTQLAIGSGETTEERWVTGMSADAWALYGARPVVGRFFGPDEDAVPAGSPVAVLSYAYWRRSFAGSPSAIGREITLGRARYRIIGVAPPGFTGSDLIASVAFIPITAMGAEIFDGSTRYYTSFNSSWMTLLVRRKPGVSVQAAEADLLQAYRRSDANSPRPISAEDAPRLRVIAGPIQLDRAPSANVDHTRRKLVLWLFGISAAVLLIACANVANLLLMTAVRRRREIAVRVALGIDRTRLVGQLLAEALLLAGVGALAGFVLAQIGGAVLRGALIPNLAWDATRPTTALIAFSVGVSLACGLGVGLVPAVRALKTDPQVDLKAGPRDGGGRRSRVRNALVVSQAALTVPLLVGAGLFVRSLDNARSRPLGIELDDVLVVEQRLRGTKMDSVAQRLLTDRMLERARSVPGVSSVTLTLGAPFVDAYISGFIMRDGDSLSLKGDLFTEVVGPEYFATVGTRVLTGRGFTSNDRAVSEPVIVLSAPLAQRLWPQGNPLGRCVRVGSAEEPCRRIVGIVEEIQSNSLNEPEPHYYLPVAQSRRSASTLLLRRESAAALPPELVRRALVPLMPDAGYVVVQTLRQAADRFYTTWEMGATMFAVFGMLALVLASLGLYAVIAYDVAQRRQEIGVRIALGARGRDVFQLVVRDGLVVAAVGIAIGLVVVGIGARWIAPLLFALSPADPGIVGGSVGVLLAVAFAASGIPARRAARVDPAVVLRDE